MAVGDDMKFFTFFALFLVLVALSPSFVSASESAVPYIGQVSDRSLSAVEGARSVLLANRSAMRDWTTKQWQDWADERFGFDTSPDGTTWRDWRKAQIKLKSDHTVASTVINKAAANWDADDWNAFADNIDHDYRSSDQYFCVILPGTQHRGEFLLGRWAYSMYENNLSERQAWDAHVASSGEGGELAADSEVKQLLQANVEVLCFVAGLLTSLLVASSWRW